MRFISPHQPSDCPQTAPGTRPQGVLQRSISVVRRSISVVRRSIAFVRRNIVAAHRRKVSRQSGFALLVVVVTVAVMGAVVSEFGYNARVEYEAASNARDQLRAEYLARSGINLSRLLIQVQLRVIDPLNRTIKSDFQIIEFAPYLLAAFGGGADEKAAMGDFLGIDTGGIKGMSSAKGTSFDVVIGTEDGKINVNCGGALQPPVGAAPPKLNAAQMASGMTQQVQNLNGAQALHSMLMSVMFSPRYDRIFNYRQPDGQFVTRDEVGRAIIDWTDFDETRFDPMAPSSGNEDYHYDQLADPYKARNHFMDTVEEMNLVRGVSDRYWGAFGTMFTVYGSCKVHLRAIGQDNWPITAAILRTAAVNPADPVLLDDTIVSALSQQMGMLTTLLPGSMGNPTDFIAALKNGGNIPTPVTPPGQAPIQMPIMPFPGLPSLVLSPQKLAVVARTGPRRIYRIDSTGTVKRAGNRKIQVHIRAIFDTVHFNNNVVSQNATDFKGTWLYWRME